jgi:hypothetical protein
LAFGSALITILANINHSRHAFRLGTAKNDPVFILRLVSLAVTALLLIASVSLPRRPNVVYNDKIVDAQFTGSILSRYTWSWGLPLVALALEKGDLEEKDIPGPDHNFRARDLVEAWHKFEFKGTLLKKLLRAYLPLFVIQWMVTILRSFVGLGPFWAMLRVIELLEQQSPTGERPMGQILAYIVSLAVFSLFGQVFIFIPCSPPFRPRRLSLLALKTETNVLYDAVDTRMGQLVCHVQNIHPSPRSTLLSYFRKIFKTKKCQDGRERSTKDRRRCDGK